MEFVNALKSNSASSNHALQMSDSSINLNNCDLEPIHILGKIQSHGFMIAIDQQYIIKFHSDNIATFIPEIAGNIIGKSLEYLRHFVKDGQNKQLHIDQVIDLGRPGNFEQVNPYVVNIADQWWYMIISPAEALLLLEFEPAAIPDEPELQGMVGSSIAEMLADKNLPDLLRNTAAQVKKIIHYDRVMIYKFADDGHGEVVAEAKNKELETWLGLHYPASDIPKQARELYKQNLTRLIADVHSIPSKILAKEYDDQPFNLTHSQLRAVSPIHIQYLKNMEVASSFSISILYKGELWGLIACHNYTPKYINFKSRTSARLIGQILSSAFEFRQDEENQQAQEAFNLSFEKLIKSLAEYDDIDQALTANEDGNLLNIAHATGAVIAYEGRITHLGITPDDAQVKMIANYLNHNFSDEVYHTDHIGKVLSEIVIPTEIACGIMFCSLSKELNEFIMWFKPERIYTVNWAGNPEKPVVTGPDGMGRISPRNSFAVWSQTVAGKSESWKVEEIKSAVRLKEEISYAINQKAGAIRILNERLRQAYDELDTFSYTISHDLKNPLSIISNYSQLMKRDGTLSERSRIFAERIDERAAKMNNMIQEILEYSRIGRDQLIYKPISMPELIQETIADLKDIYGEHSEFVVGDLPDIHGDPLMIRQVFANLIGNAVKYSQSAVKPMISISGTTNGKHITYRISDNGIGIPEQHLSTVFELFKRMENVKDIEGSGVGLAIVKRILDKHKATISVESDEAKGAVFYINFISF